MKIAVVGTGYVGLVSGVCFAELGHHVICTDVDVKKIKQLKRGKVPIYEAGLKEILDRNVELGRLTFTTDTVNAIKKSEIVFSAVGTPMGENYEADLSYVKAVAKTFAEAIDKYTVLVTKSTVPVGTGEMVKKIISKHTNVKFDIVSNPEFLQEGKAVSDFMEPDRIIVGCENNKACEMMKRLYEPLTRTDSPLIITDIRSSELIKYAANAMLATRISFINEIALYSDIVGANVKEVSRGMGLDDRIGPRFLQAGLGYGGSCFPKDVSALIESGKQEGYMFQILEAVEAVNKAQKHVVIAKLKKHIKNLEGKNILVWGVAFKSETNDVRQTPAATIIEELNKADANVFAYDPVAREEFERHYTNLNLKFLDDKYEDISKMDALLLVTDWEEFKILDHEKLSKMRNKLLVDGRNIYNPKDLRARGFVYEGIGQR